MSDGDNNNAIQQQNAVLQDDESDPTIKFLEGLGKMVKAHTDKVDKKICVTDQKGLVAELKEKPASFKITRKLICDRGVADLSFDENDPLRKLGYLISSLVIEANYPTHEANSLILSFYMTYGDLCKSKIADKLNQQFKHGLKRQVSQTSSTDDDSIEKYARRILVWIEEVLTDKMVDLLTKVEEDEKEKQEEESRFSKFRRTNNKGKGKDRGNPRDPCYAFLRNGICNKTGCQFNHKVPDTIEDLKKKCREHDLKNVDFDSVFKKMKD